MIASASSSLVTILSKLNCHRCQSPRNIVAQKNEILSIGKHVFFCFATRSIIVFFTCLLDHFMDPPKKNCDSTSHGEIVLFIHGGIPSHLLFSQCLVRLQKYRRIVWGHWVVSCDNVPLMMGKLGKLQICLTHFNTSYSS